MNKSYFYTQDETYEFLASEEFSEWLFETGFWREINSICNTMFDQFEEDDASVFVSEKILQLLIERIGIVETMPNSSIKLQWGWDETGEPLFAYIEQKILLKELILMRDFFSLTVGNGLFVTCQL